MPFPQKAEKPKKKTEQNICLFRKKRKSQLEIVCLF